MMSTCPSKSAVGVFFAALVHRVFVIFQLVCSGVVVCMGLNCHMGRFCGVVVVVAVAWGLPSAAACPEGYTSFGITAPGRCFQYFSDRLTFSEAALVCSLQGGSVSTSQYRESAGGILRFCRFNKVCERRVVKESRGFTSE